MDVRDNNTNLKPSPEKEASGISRLFLIWLLPFFKLGSRKKLELTDVYHAPPEDASEKLGDQMETEWNKEVKKAKLDNQPPRLWRVVARIIGVKNVFLGVGLSLDELVLRPVQALALRNFIKSFSVNNPNLHQQKYFYATLLVLASLAHGLLSHILFTSILSTGVRLRLGASSLIYRKILCLRKSNSDQANVGKICNLLSIDMWRLEQCFHTIHHFYIAPIQLTIYIYLLWDTLGVASLGGIAALALCLPVQIWVVRLFLHYRVRTNKRSDERGRFLNEIISGIRLIKMYAWEKPFAAVIAKLREKEIHFIRWGLYLHSINVSIYTFAARLIPFCALILYVALGNKLTADKAFFTIAIFNMIVQEVVERVARYASRWGELKASLKRVEDFLLSDLKNDAVSHGERETKEPKIMMRNYSASWTEEKETLQNWNVNLSGAKLVMVVGHVGAGKSSFLNAILHELPIIDADSKLDIQGRISYASQEAWIFPGTLRDNALFGLPFEERRYWDTLKLCCLEDDLNQLPQGDLSLMGERGVTLSGGQKARVNLARALYQEADIYLMDDPLSAVDTKISKQLFHECIMGSLKDKMRILVTHQLQYLPMADHIIVLNRDGSIWGQGTYDELKNSDIDFTSLISDKYMSTRQQNMDETLANSPEQKTENAQDSEATSGNELRRRRRKQSNDASEKVDSIEEKVKEEPKKASKVSIATYLRYFEAGGSPLTIVVVLVAFLATQVLLNSTDYWLSLWTSEMNEQGNVYAYVYCALMTTFITVTVFRSLLFFRYCMKVSINLHDGMFASLVRAPVKFFDDNPSGQIMNRFTSELSSIDKHLPIALYDYANVFLRLFGMMALNISANYYLSVPSLLLFVTLWKLRQFYNSTAQDLMRIESDTLTPRSTHVITTVQGLTTVRALRAEARVLQKFEKIQDINISVYYLWSLTERWLALWLEMSNVLFLAIVAFGFLALSNSVEGGNVGVAIAAILSLSGGFQDDIIQSVNTENGMSLVERSLEYSNLTPEAPLETVQDKQVTSNPWPGEGRIEFQNLKLAYDDAKENQVLKGVTFSTESGEKIGIVGRTGAGKTSLLAALFRLTEPCEGQIVIDGVPISSLGLHTLRSRISIIPQDPVLFTGTLRYNLDPFTEFSNDELKAVLREVNLHHAFQNLDAPVADSGGNFSVGQRQLVCLARAILRKNRILVLDEVTANCDPFTDMLLQRTIRTKFADCTILTIAHRLQTVLDNDRILVMDKGKVVEFDSPKALGERKGGVFYSMLKHYKSGDRNNND